MRKIKMLAPFEDYRPGDTPTVLGSRGRQLVGLGVAEWVMEGAAPVTEPVEAQPEPPKAKTGKAKK